MFRAMLPLFCLYHIVAIVLPTSCRATFDQQFSLVLFAAVAAAVAAVLCVGSLSLLLFPSLCILFGESDLALVVGFHQVRYGVVLRAIPIRLVLSALYHVQLACLQCAQRIELLVPLPIVQVVVLQSLVQ
jgi:hypothetical protein